jgi:coatomer subunit beta
MLNGDPQTGLLMHIIRFIMPSKSKPLKKLMYFFFEVCPKHDAQGKLRQEWILVWWVVSQQYRVTAADTWEAMPSVSTCRRRTNTCEETHCASCRDHTFQTIPVLTQCAGPSYETRSSWSLCSVSRIVGFQWAILTTIAEPVRQCLTHRHAYVRKNATFAVASIFTHLPELMPDAPDILTSFLDDENDPTCKRNAFAALVSVSHEKALEYISTVFDSIPNHEELLLLAELEFIRKDAIVNPQNKARYLRLIFDLLESQVSTVIYEAAHALTTLTSNPVAIKAAASKFVELAIKEPDNNVKLIVLERVDQLRQKHEGVLDDLTMEVLRVLSSTDLDVRKKSLKIAMEMISSRNVEEVVLLLKKELMKTVDEQYEKNSEYRSLLISSIHSAAIKFPEVAASVVGSLMDFISDVSSSASAVDVISFVKEVVERFPDLRSSIIERLVSTLGEVRAGKVYRGVLWIIGEFSLEAKDIRDAWKGIRSSLGEIPILASEQRLLDEASEGKEYPDPVNGDAKSAAPTGSRKVLADGTYATESALTSSAAAKAKLEAVKNSQKPPLRQLVLDGDYYLATVLSSTLTKLVMRHSEISKDVARTNALRAEAMLIMISIIRVGQSQFVKTFIDEDSVDRIMSCVRSLSEFAQRKELETVFLEDTRKSFAAMVQTEEKKRAAKEASERARSAVNVDDSFNIRQLRKKDADGSDEVEQDVERATGGDTATEDMTSKLSRVVQLTGFSDFVYAEAYVKVGNHDDARGTADIHRCINSTLYSMYSSSTKQQKHYRISQSSLQRWVI